MERTRNKSYLPSNVCKIENYGRRGLLVWTGIMLDSRKPLHVLERGSVTGVRYRYEVFESYVQLFWSLCSPKFILMDYTERPHRIFLVNEFRESEDIHRLDWSGRSLHFNPIDHVWNGLGRAFATRTSPQPRTIQERKTALLNEWN
ncbi:transposable element Tc1 transposase [Trichonephila clavipes]|nr:transposable element Tc1 transposase [Trichonephila clavipes]